MPLVSSTVAGTPASWPCSASSPALALPPEIWAAIVSHLEDRCYAWLVLRRVCSGLRHVTEQVFAKYLFRTCSVRVSGQCAREILAARINVWPFREPDSEMALRNGNDEEKDCTWWPLSLLQNYPPTFLLKPSSFVPQWTRHRAIFTLHDHVEDYMYYETLLADHDQNREPLTSYWTPFYTRRRVCVCPNRVETPADIARCTCLADLFFSSYTNRLLTTQSHLVRFDGQLKCIHIPSLSVDAFSREISIDWRHLCQSFYIDELKCRQAFQHSASNEWINRFMEA